MKKSDREIMEILEAFDATGCAHSAAALAGVDPKSVRRYVAKRAAGEPLDGPVKRVRIVDAFVPKIEEMVTTSDGAVPADVAHERLVAMGFTGDERTTRRAVAQAKAAYRDGHRRSYRRWITEPGLWLQFDWGQGPVVFGPDGRARSTALFCAWLAWSRFRVVIPTWDRRMGTLLSCLDATFRACGGVPAFALTDNEKTVTVEHIAGVPVRHPMIVAAGRHYGLTVHTCVPFDPPNATPDWITATSSSTWPPRPSPRPGSDLNPDDRLVPLVTRPDPRVPVDPIDAPAVSMTDACTPPGSPAVGGWPPRWRAPHPTCRCDGPGRGPACRAA